ncbi:hypothetical protein CBM2614_B160077 [Cupriavidus taiwanensis]|nr:hypothetical protein CBM2614_B160077 [Cupriavidus taiwanensis]
MLCPIVDVSGWRYSRRCEQSRHARNRHRADLQHASKSSKRHTTTPRPSVAATNLPPGPKANTPPQPSSTWCFAQLYTPYKWAGGANRCNCLQRVVCLRTQAAVNATA